MRFESTDRQTIQYRIPDQATFDTLIDIQDLPGHVLELAETRKLADQYLDSPDHQLLRVGSSCRVNRTGQHHFLITVDLADADDTFHRQIEVVERLTPGEIKAHAAGEGALAALEAVKTRVGGRLGTVLTRNATHQSKLLRSEHCRFELGLEAVIYERNGQVVGEQLLTLDRIEGSWEDIEAVGEALARTYGLELVTETPYERGMRLTTRVASSR